MDNNIFDTLRLINNRLANLEGNIARLEEKVEDSVGLLRCHLVRVKNGEQINDDIILGGKSYNDLSPDRAYKLYKNPDLDFIILDVCAEDFAAPGSLDSILKIPYENLAESISRITSKNSPILVISENGVTSILACELLVKNGFMNVNNISGGYKFWPGFRFKESLSA